MCRGAGQRTRKDKGILRKRYTEAGIWVKESGETKKIREVQQFVQGQTLSLASGPATTLGCPGASAGLMECPINKFLNPQTQNWEGAQVWVFKTAGPSSLSLQGALIPPRTLGNSTFLPGARFLPVPSTRVPLLGLLRPASSG